MFLLLYWFCFRSFFLQPIWWKAFTINVNKFVLDRVGREEFGEMNLFYIANYKMELSMQIVETIKKMREVA